MSILRSLLKNNLIKNFIASSAVKKQFHTSLVHKKDDCKDKDKSVDLVPHPVCIEPVTEDFYTARKHDNFKRQRLYEFGLYVAACMPKYVQLVQMQHCDELELLIHPEGLFPVLSFLRYHQHANFEVCSSMTGMDVPGRVYRFEVVYNILSLRFAERIRVRTYTDEFTPVHSAYELWKVCNYFERECYDMFGIIFSHHPDLRRILTDYGFDGHPLRKDFPLVGYTEVRYDDELKKLVWEPVEFAQEMRNYNLKCPWTYYKKFHEGYDAPPPPKKK